MRDDEKKAKGTSARAGRTGTAMPDRCGAMFERMLEACGGTAKAGANGERARHSAAERLRSCASMMEEMASRCRAPSPEKATSDE